MKNFNRIIFILVNYPFHISAFGYCNPVSHLVNPPSHFVCGCRIYLESPNHPFLITPTFAFSRRSKSSSPLQRVMGWTCSMKLHLDTISQLNSAAKDVLEEQDCCLWTSGTDPILRWFRKDLVTSKQSRREEKREHASENGLDDFSILEWKKLSCWTRL